MYFDPPDTAVVGGACGTLVCTSNSFRHPTSLLLMPFSFTSDQRVANLYCSTLLFSTVITQHLDVSGGKFYSCPTFLSLSATGFFLSVRHCHQWCPLRILSSFDLCYWHCPLLIFSSSDLSVVPYSGESCCSYKIHWISNHDACCGTVYTNAMASRHCCLNHYLFVLSQWELLPTWKAGSDKCFVTALQRMHTPMVNGIENYDLTLHLFCITLHW